MALPWPPTSSMVPSVPFCRAHILLCNSLFCACAPPSFHSFSDRSFCAGSFCAASHLRSIFDVDFLYFFSFVVVGSLLFSSNSFFSALDSPALLHILGRWWCVFHFWSWIENHLRHSFGMRPNATTLPFTERWLLPPLQIFGIWRNAATTQYTNERDSRRESNAK